MVIRRICLNLQHRIPDDLFYNQVSVTVSGGSGFLLPQETNSARQNKIDIALKKDFILVV
jgi:hypothetical protein